MWELKIKIIMLLLLLFITCCKDENILQPDPGSTPEPDDYPEGYQFDLTGQVWEIPTGHITEEIPRGIVAVNQLAHLMVLFGGKKGKLCLLPE